MDSFNRPTLRTSHARLQLPDHANKERNRHTGHDHFRLKVIPWHHAHASGFWISRQISRRCAHLISSNHLDKRAYVFDDPPNKETKRLNARQLLFFDENRQFCIQPQHQCCQRNPRRKSDIHAPKRDHAYKKHNRNETHQWIRSWTRNSCIHWPKAHSRTSFAYSQAVERHQVILDRWTSKSCCIYLIRDKFNERRWLPYIHRTRWNREILVREPYSGCHIKHCTEKRLLQKIRPCDKLIPKSSSPKDSLCCSSSGSILCKLLLNPERHRKTHLQT